MIDCRKNMKNNKNNQEIKFQIEMETLGIERQVEPRKTIRLAEKNLKKLLLNRINGKTGECQRIKNKVKLKIIR